MTPVEMPKANENLTEATLDRWLVKVGDSVAKDQSLCDIITDKAKFEMPSPAAGQILKIFAPERAMLPVGYVMCFIGAANETVPAEISVRNQALLEAHRNAATAMTASSHSGTVAPAAPLAAGSGVRATPAARRIAKEAGIDLSEVARVLKLSAPISEKDIKTYLESKK
jgi:pyruvate dehydrogenase E2 component (dihydrolipoamide acetyltransferase)